MNNNINPRYLPYSKQEVQQILHQVEIIDTAPADDSPNPVSSGGVKAAIETEGATRSLLFDISTISAAGSNVLPDVASKLTFNFSGEPVHTAPCFVDNQSHLLVCAHHSAGDKERRFFWDFFAKDCVGYYTDSNVPDWVLERFYENSIPTIQSALQFEESDDPASLFEDDSSSS